MYKILLEKYLDKTIEFIKHLVSKPTIALSFAVIVITSIVMTVIYQERKELIGIYIAKHGQEQFIAKLDETQFAMQIAKLVHNSKALSGTIWSVDLATNQKKLLYSLNAKTDTRARSQFFNYVTPFFGSSSKLNAAMVELQKYPNHSVCYELEIDNEFDEHVHAEGVNWICAISVPPESGQFIGMITLGFESQPTDIDGVFNRRLINAANKVTKYK